MAAEILNLQLWVSDYDFVKDLTMQESVNSWAVFLNGAHISMQSEMHYCTTSLVMEAELVVATACVQDMLFLIWLMELIGMMVKKPIVLTVDNKGTKDLANNWSVGSCKWHIDI